MPRKANAVQTAIRYIDILRLIPEEPDRISTTQILNLLNDDGRRYDVSTRTIQRDLEHLSGAFGLQCKLIGRKHYWYLLKKEPILQVPAMGASTALTLKMAQEYLAPVMPADAMLHLKGYFGRAEDVLKKTNLANWPSKVKIIRRGPMLLPPRIDPGIQDAIYEGLLQGKKIWVAYRRRGASEAKEYELNPLGIVSKDGIIYLVATVWDYDDPGQYALHRVQKAQVLDAPADVPSHFSLDQYVFERREFSYPRSKKQIKLRAYFNNDSAVHLLETPLSEDQKTRDTPDGRVLVTATVPDSVELRWWLLGFGSNVEVQSPASLRKYVHQTLLAAVKAYRG